ncbi:MAG: PEGA domain-containing protein [bacterium]
MKILDGRYQFEGLLSERGPAKLWLATDRELKRSLAIREIGGRPPRGPSPVDGVLWATCALTQVRHQTLEEVIALREDNERNIFAFCTYEEAIPWHKLIAQAGRQPLQSEEVLYLLGQAASGLAVAHTARERVSGRSWRLFHHSLNPENLFVTRAGQVQITGFGLASLEIEPSLSELAYLAPEQLDGGIPDGAADIFSLGVIGYELLTGRALFMQPGKSELMTAILKGEYDLSEMARISSDGVAVEIITRCLYRELHHRFQSAAQVADKIKAVLQTRDFDPERKLRERVANLYETPKLETADLREQHLRTKVFESSAFIQTMGEQMSGYGQSGGKKPKPGEETVIASLKMGERVRRMSPGGGGSLVKILAIVAAVLAVVIIAILVREWLNRPGAPVTELRTGEINTLPAGAEVYLADSLVGTTPGVFTLKPESEITIKHPCCPDTAVMVDFEQFAEGPLELTTMLRIVSNPIGADVMVNGEKLEGETPYDLPVRGADTVQINLAYSGRKDISLGPIAVVDLIDTEDKNFDIGTLAEGGFEVTGIFAGQPRPEPKVKITSYPSGATVTISQSNEVVGTTPVSYSFENDPVKLVLSLPGYEDAVYTIPAASARQSSYQLPLFRRIWVTAYEEGDIEKTVECSFKEVEWLGKRRENEDGRGFEQATPAYVRLPGTECRILLSAPGYYDTDTIVTASQKELIAVMQPQAGQSTASTEQAPPTQTTQATPQEGVIPQGQAEVRIFVTDKDDRPVSGSTITAEYENGDRKENLELGVTDADGKLVRYVLPGKYKFIAKHLDYKLGKESQEVKVGGRYVKTISIKRR